MMFNPTFARIAALALASLLMTGCSAMTPGPMTAVRPVSTAPRAGNVYLVRGWIGIFSTGIDALGQKVTGAGLHGQVFQEDQWRALAATIADKYRGVRDPEPLVLVGHSYGADDIVRIARELDAHDVPVDLLVTIDPTTPPRVPKNVRLCYNLYQSNLLDAMPFLRGIPLEADPGFAGQLRNVNIRTDRPDLVEGKVDHFNIEKKDTIHRETLRQILAVCPPRAQWAAARPPRLAPMTTVAQVRTVSAPAASPTTRPSAAADTRARLLSSSK
jgi:pimeloyl-ACP methyl ester carboxylesterase